MGKCITYNQLEKAGMAIQISHKIGFETKIITGNKKRGLFVVIVVLRQGFTM